MKMKQIKPRIMVFDKRQKKPKGKSRIDNQQTHTTYIRHKTLRQTQHNTEENQTIQGKQFLHRSNTRKHPKNNASGKLHSHALLQIWRHVNIHDNDQSIDIA